MSYDNRLELIITAEPSQANSAIRGVNTSILGLERQTAVSTAMASSGMDRMAANAAKSMGRTTQQMHEARQAAMLLSHSIGIQLPRAVTGFLGKSSALGTFLTSAFKVSIWASIGIAIWEAGKRLLEWADNSKKAADESRKLTDEIVKQTETFDKYAANIEAAKRKGSLIGLSGSARTQAEIGATQADIDRATIERGALLAASNQLWIKSQKLVPAHAGAAPSKELQDAIAAYQKNQDAIALKENEIAVAKQERANLEKQLTIEVREEEKKAASERTKYIDDLVGKWQQAALLQIDQAKQVWEAWRREYDGFFGAAMRDTEKLREKLDELRPRGILENLPSDESGSLEDLLKPRITLPGGSSTGSRVSNQVSTIVTDWSSAMARAAFDIRSAGSILLSAARSTAEMFIRAVLESTIGRSFAAMGLSAAGAYGATGSGGGGGGGGVPGAGSAGGGIFSNLGGLWKNGQWMKTAGGMAGILGGSLMLSGAQRGSSLQTIGGGAMMGAGIGLAGGPIGALGGAGIGLALNGLRQGGWGGLAQTTAGGAMLGAQIGTTIFPGIGTVVGTAIGAGIGFVAGLVRLFIKGAIEKAREKIKATYGVDVQDKGVLKQIVQMAKDSFGGNLDMAIRSAQIRDLIELYAMTTAQNSRGIVNRMTPATFMQSGGSLFQQPSYSNGLPGAGLSRSSAGGITVNVTVPEIVVQAPNAQDLLTTGVLRIVRNNPRPVQGAVLTATRSSSGRRELTSLQLSPGTLTS